jgi:AGCS family alanine or glycine:cation symporter
VNAGGSGSVDEAISNVLSPVSDIITSIVFYSVTIGDASLPLIVVWLVVAATFFTVYLGFLNIRGFRHAIDLVRGKYSNPDDAGEVSHFQALATAVSGTVGLGNIAGVAVAISLGGPGATFWMILAGFLGMSTKLAECTLGVKYRNEHADGTVSGGPMYYLERGVGKVTGKAALGKTLAVMFAIFAIGGSLGGGNMFQANQATAQIVAVTGGENSVFAGLNWVIGVGFAIAVGLVIIGGIKSIARVTSKLVPLMAAIYILACLIILGANFSDLPVAFGEIFAGAFTPEGISGGFVGVLIVGFQRAAFSNEAGIGSASIAHSAVRTKHPSTEGYVALLEPFIDTIVICTMTALVIVFSGAYANPAYADIVASNQGAALTSRAFGEDLTFFPYILSLAVVLFAYSTMISWSYYGERSAVWLFGQKASMPYKALFLVFVFLGSILTATNVLAFGDLMILGMAFPNLLGVYILHGKVKSMLSSYWADYKAGKHKVYDVSREH